MIWFGDYSLELFHDQVLLPFAGQLFYVQKIPRFLSGIIVFLSIYATSTTSAR